MRGLALLFVLAVIAAPARPGGGRSTGGRSPDQLAISSTLLSKLQTLAGGLHHEIILCLLGDVVGDTARVSEFMMPEPMRSTVGHSSARPCPSGSIAAWHNHPTMSLAPFEPGQGEVDSREPGAMCALSAADLRSADLHAFPFVVISVDRDTWCWWTQTDVARFRAQGLSVAMALPGQRSWDVPQGGLVYD